NKNQIPNRTSRGRLYRLALLGLAKKSLHKVSEVLAQPTMRALSKIWLKLSYKNWFKVRQYSYGRGAFRRLTAPATIMMAVTIAVTGIFLYFNNSTLASSN